VTSTGNGGAAAAGGASGRPIAAAAAPTRGGSRAPAPASFDLRVDRVERSIDQFRVDAERYFNGGLNVPPEELRARIERELRDLRLQPLRSAADQFRLGGLEARFNSLGELFARRLREREEGRSTIAPRPPAPEPPRHDARLGIVVSDAGERETVEALWQGLAASGGGARFELETFRGYLAQQLDQIRARTGSAAVQFRVVEEEGRVKLKAKPLGAAGE
jgi:hypothetical protein